jgi:hypothetical protein
MGSFLSSAAIEKKIAWRPQAVARVFRQNSIFLNILEFAHRLKLFFGRGAGLRVRGANSDHAAPMRPSVAASRGVDDPKRTPALFQLAFLHLKRTR